MQPLPHPTLDPSQPLFQLLAHHVLQWWLGRKNPLALHLLTIVMTWGGSVVSELPLQPFQTIIVTRLLNNWILQVNPYIMSKNQLHHHLNCQVVSLISLCLSPRERRRRRMSLHVRLIHLLLIVRTNSFLVSDVTPFISIFSCPLSLVWTAGRSAPHHLLIPFGAGLVSSSSSVSSLPLHFRRQWNLEETLSRRVWIWCPSLPSKRISFASVFSSRLEADKSERKHFRKQ